MNQLNANSISVIEPISQAFEKTKQILFNPFDMSKWFAIGFCAWLANLCQGGGSGGGGGGGGNPGTNNVGQTIQNVFANHLPLVITIGSILLVLLITLILVCLWLSSRGRFMFLHCVANNVGEVKRPWHKFRGQGNSLFLFRLCVGLIIFICIAVLGGLAAMVVLMSGNFDQMSVASIASIIAIVLIIIPLFISLAIFLKFTIDFVVPLMYLHGTGTVDAWREFSKMLGQNKCNFLLYILFQIVIAICVTTLIIALICMTCCVAGCILMIPYIGTVLVLPVLVFCRSYSLLYFAQYGPEYDVFFRGDDDISEAELVIPELPQQ
jgi:hypothetical protein